MKPASENPIAAELRRDFPRLWELAEGYDFAERLGGAKDGIEREADQALRELWMGRVNAMNALRESSGSGTEHG